MTDAQALDIVRSVLHEVAPEADLAQTGPDEPLREALDLDSIDFLNFAQGLHQRTGIDIPEADYGHLATLGGCVAYLRNGSSA